MAFIPQPLFSNKSGMSAAWAQSRGEALLDEFNPVRNAIGNGFIIEVVGRVYAAPRYHRYQS